MFTPAIRAMLFFLLLHRPYGERPISALRGPEKRAPKTGKADARTDAPPDTGDRDGGHVGFESRGVNSLRREFREVADWPRASCEARPDLESRIKVQANARCRDRDGRRPNVPNVRTGHGVGAQRGSGQS